MEQVISYIAANPEAVLFVVGAVESLVMPFIPVKYNGLAVTLFGFLKKKKAGAR